MNVQSVLNTFCLLKAEGIKIMHQSSLLSKALGSAHNAVTQVGPEREFNVRLFTKPDYEFGKFSIAHGKNRRPIQAKVYSSN